MTLKAMFSALHVGHVVTRNAMSDRLPASMDMADAERRIREALSGPPGERMSALWNLYEQTPADKLDPLIAVLIARVAIPPRPVRTGEAA
jgi:hypothetical protein